MKGKVTCSSCGWSWNKSDSSKKDMYICHECGRDNSNNMKNGGWLDNYNDYEVSAPEGFEGDGYSNVGRNYSPAWGGQFKEGGEIDPPGKKKKPIYVESKNDPRYQAYQDSLKAYNEGNYKYNNIKKTGNLKDLKVDVDSEKKLPFNKFIKEYNYNDNAFNLFNQGTNKNMKPISISHFRGDGILGYLDYGNQALYKKPEQQVIVKDKVNTSTDLRYKSESQYKKEHPPIYITDKNDPRINTYTEEGSQYLYRPVEKKPIRAIKNNLRPEGLVTRNTDLYSDLPTIRPTAKNAKSYKVKETIQGKYAPSTVEYQVTDPRNINMNDLGPGNTRVVTPQYQEGGKLKFLQPTDKNLPEGYVIPYSTPSSERAMSIGGENGEPAYLIPSFKYGQPLDDPMGEFRKTGEHLGGPFKTWQEADEWERTVRHPAVEKGENIMFPQEQFAMGGSVPGAVGFTYARTKGIPSNGPYAKKTLASAQDGEQLDMHGNPMFARRVDNPNINRSYYDPRLNTMNIGTDYTIWKDDEGNQLTGEDLKLHQDQLLAHENYHAIQHSEGRDNYDIAHDTDDRLWAEMQNPPQMMTTDAVWNNFYNRSQLEDQQDYERLINDIPETRILNQNLLFDKVLDSQRYDNPSNLEGEAKYYEEMGEEYKYQNGGSMSYYQH